MDWFDKIFALFVSGVMLFFAVTLLMNFSGYSCQKTAEIVEMEHRHSIATGCYLKVDGVWIAYSQLTPAQVNGKTVYVPTHNLRINLETQAK